MSQPKVMISNVEMVPINGLTLHPKNRNKHPEEQIERLARILEYQGFRYPVKVSKRSGYVTSGHGRIEAARLNGWTHVPVSYQDYESDEQEYADLIADNSIASWAELDLSGINADLGDLGPDFDLDLLGLRGFSIDPSELPSLEDKERAVLRQVAFQVTVEQEEQIQRALHISKRMGEFGETGNANSNGNAIARVCEIFVTSQSDEYGDS